MRIMANYTEKCSLQKKLPSLGHHSHADDEQTVVHPFSLPVVRISKFYSWAFIFNLHPFKCLECMSDLMLHRKLQMTALPIVPQY